MGRRSVAANVLREGRVSNHEEGLVDQYIREIRALGVRAETGANVQADVRAVVAKACEHFRVVKTSSPQANLAAFKSKLKAASDRADSLLSGYKRTLKQAASACPPEI